MSSFYLQLGSENNMRSMYEQRDRKLARKLRKETKENARERERERESRRAEATVPLIISITYANLRGETGLDAIRSNYFTLAKRLLLVSVAGTRAQIRGGIAESSRDTRKRDRTMGCEVSDEHGYSGRATYMLSPRTASLS